MPNSTTVLPSAARTATATATLGLPQGTRGVLIIVDVTADPALAAVTPSIEAKDENGDYNATIWTAAAAIAATGESSYMLYPGAVTADFDGTEAVGFGIPGEWQLTMTHADTDSFTYSVRAHFLP